MSDRMDSAARRKPPIAPWTILSHEDAGGIAMTLPDDFAGDETDALLDLLLQAYGGPKFSRDNPAIADAVPMVRVQVWHSCTKAWCEAEGIDPETYGSGWFAPHGDGKRWVNVVWYPEDFYDLGDAAQQAEREALRKEPLMSADRPQGSAAWLPEPGDFFRPRQPRGRVHIAAPRGPNDPAGAVRAACGVGNFYFRVVPASGDEFGRQCAKCWEAM